MVFKRRTPPGWLDWLRNVLWPRGGWGRAVEYMGHRLRRLPDSPHRVSVGVAAGVFVSFSPLFGFHFLAAMLVAFILRGNLLAAAIATFVGNPVTFPAIGYVSLKVGHVLVDGPEPGNFADVTKRFGDAFVGLWRTLKSFAGYGEPAWDLLSSFFFGLFLPYLIGGLIPGAIAGVASYYVARPLVRSYQKRRREQRMIRFTRAARVAEAARAKELKDADR